MNKVLILVLSLLMFAVPVLAEEGDVDLSSMSTDELIGLRKLVNIELNSRFNNEESSIYSGKYVVGADIQEGTYVLTCLETPFALLYGVFATEEDYSVYKAYTSGENFNENSKFHGHIYLDEQAYLPLHAGEILHLSDGSGIIRPVEPDWAP